MLAFVMLANVVSLSNAAAAAYDRPTQTELKMIPDYCPYTQDIRSDIPGAASPQNWDRWIKVIGPVFEDMHHYCWALILTLRATDPRRKNERGLLLTEALDNFDYILRHTKPDFVLNPEIHTKRGVLLLRMGKEKEASESFRIASTQKPDYWPAYGLRSDFYVEQGKPDLARVILQDGLKNSPGEKALTRRLADLDEAKTAKNTKKPTPDASKTKDTKDKKANEK